MPQREVLNLVVREHLSLCAEHGLGAGALLRDLGTTEDDLADRAARTRWNGYAAMLGRAMRTLGPDGLAGLGAAWVDTSRALALTGALAKGARDLLRTLCGRILPTAYANVGFSARVIDPSTVFVGVAVPRPSDGGLALLSLLQGVLSALPRLVGEPPATVRAEIAPHGGRFAVGSAAGSRRGRADGVASAEDIEAMLALVHGDAFLFEQARRLGTALAAETRSDALAHRLRTILRDRFACDSFVLSAPPVEIRSGPSPGPRTCHKRLVAAGRDVGFIETPALGLSSDGAAPLWDALVVWIALGVERCLSARADQRRAPGRPMAQYGLTPRESSVVKLLAEGRTNKEIAVSLGLAERTVETHLFNAFRKAGVPNRASLVSAYFTATRAVKAR